MNNVIPTLLTRVPKAVAMKDYSSSHDEPRGIFLRSLILVSIFVTFTPSRNAPAQESPPVRSFATIQQDAPVVEKSNRQETSSKKQKTKVKSKRQIKKTIAVPPSVAATQRDILSGFNPETDGFNFANWSGAPNPQEGGINLLTQLFGSNSICDRLSTPTKCHPFASAATFANSVDSLLVNGRCEGMVVLASKLFNASKLRSPSSPTIKMKKSQLLNQISFWWGTQMLPSVASESKRTKSMRPTDLVELIAWGVLGGATSSLGIYSDDAGHTLLPIGFHQNGTSVVIDVYDSNVPGLTQHLLINTANDSWSYTATTANGIPIMQWSGSGAGSLDVVPIALRTPQFTASFANSK